MGSWVRDTKMLSVVNWTVITYGGGREPQEGRGTRAMQLIPAVVQQKRTTLVAVIL